MSESFSRWDAGLSEHRARRALGAEVAPDSSLSIVRPDPDHGRSAPPYWLSLESNSPIPAEWLAPEAVDPSSVRSASEHRGNDDSLICGCPGCGAPLSIRRWLMSADCWQCGISVAVAAHRPFY